MEHEGRFNPPLAEGTLGLFSQRPDLLLPSAVFYGAAGGRQEPDKLLFAGQEVLGHEGHAATEPADAEGIARRLGTAGRDSPPGRKDGRYRTAGREARK